MDLKQSNVVILKAWNNINKVMLHPHTLDPNGYIYDNSVQGEFLIMSRIILIRNWASSRPTTLLSYGGISNISNIS